MDILSLYIQINIFKYRLKYRLIGKDMMELLLTWYTPPSTPSVVGYVWV